MHFLQRMSTELNLMHQRWKKSELQTFCSEGAHTKKAPMSLSFDTSNFVVGRRLCGGRTKQALCSAQARPPNMPATKLGRFFFIRPYKDFVDLFLWVRIPNFIIGSSSIKFKERFALAVILCRFTFQIYGGPR